MLTPEQRTYAYNLALPSEERLDDQQFAGVFNVTDRTLRNWKKGREFTDLVKAYSDQRDSSTSLLADRAYEWGLMQLIKGYHNAKNGSEQQRRMLKDIIEMAGERAQTNEPVRTRDMTDDDLLAICIGAGVSVAGLTVEQMRAQLKGAPCQKTSTEEASSDSSEDSPPS